MTDSPFFVIPLGTAGAFPSKDRDNTSLLVRAGRNLLIVDCPGSIVQKLRKAGVPPWDIRTVILTHDHVDHISGLPSLIFVHMGRTDAISIYGPSQCLRTVKKMLGSLGLIDPRTYPPCHFIPVPMKEGAEIIAIPSLAVHATPADHSRDTIAVRVRAGAASFVHTSDTRRCERIADLAKGCTALFHDCFTIHTRMKDAFSNHSSAREAGEIASNAGVRRLYLIHLDTQAPIKTKALLREARASFRGHVSIPTDLHPIRI